VKQHAKSWTPYEYDQLPFKGEDIFKRTGLIMPEQHATSLFSSFINSFITPVRATGNENTFSAANSREVEKRFTREHALKAGLPQSFDARSQWPACIHGVRNQKQCGSCWAFSSVGMFEDRLCIASGSTITERLSPEDLVQCNTNNGGCNGGLLSFTVDYLITEGVVTETCMPYISGVGTNGFCKYGCTDPTLPYVKYYCKPGSLVVPSTPEAIMTEVMTNGPVQVGFLIWSDFMTYQSGIYFVTPSINN
jgi:Papain family cysteine protease